MKVATLLFTYNRSYHTKQVLESLKKNSMIPDKLFIFQDGLKEGGDIDEWNKVNILINEIKWCEKEIIVSKNNNGLANSIVSGINYAFKEYEAVIVLEDDCIPSSNFICFMNQCFDKYENDKRIFSVSGYSWPIKIYKQQYDIYGCGRISSWGWGTWRDRWKGYCIDNNMLKRFKTNEILSRSLATWGSDCESILLGNITGKTDSWAVYWALHVIEHDGICINPYKSLIQNIGFDGSGVHCEKTDKYQVVDLDESIRQFELPDKIEILKTTKIAFAELYGCYTALDSDEDKEDIIVYGIGNFYFQNEKKINSEYNIKAFIDRQKQGWFAGKKIIRLDELKQFSFKKIIVMVMDIQDCIDIVKILMSYGVDYKKIQLGCSLYGTYKQCIDKISILSNGDLMIVIDGISIAIQSKSEFNNVFKVLVEQIYCYYINNNKKDVVIDVGMNIGETSLFFLNNSKVEKVYAYEFIKQLYLRAKKNLQEFIHNTNRIEIFQCRISGNNDKYMTVFNENMILEQSTINEIKKEAQEDNTSYNSFCSERIELGQIEVRKASTEFKSIIQQHTTCNIVLKIDCESEECNILEELSREGMLCKFSLIILQWHYKEKDILLACLKKSGFSYWFNNKLGLIYAYNTKM